MGTAEQIRHLVTVIAVALSCLALGYGKGSHDAWQTSLSMQRNAR